MRQNNIMNKDDCIVFLAIEPYLKIYIVETSMTSIIDYRVK